MPTNSGLCPNAANTFHYQGGQPFHAALTQHHRQGSTLFLKGIYKYCPERDEVCMDTALLLQMLADFKTVALEGFTIYLLSEGKELKLKPTAEILAASQLQLSRGVWDFSLMPPMTRVEAAVTTSSGSIVLGTMCSPYSNFGQEPIRSKLSAFVSLEDIRALHSDPSKIDWAVVGLALELELLSVEMLINGALKISLGELMPARLSGACEIHYADGICIAVAVPPSVATFLANVQRLESVSVNGCRPFKAAFCIHSSTGLWWFQGQGLHTEPVYVASPSALVKVANSYVNWAVRRVLEAGGELDKNIKALGNSQHISAAYFEGIANGPLGANTLIQAAGYLLRCLTNADFERLTLSLLKLDVRIREYAIHIRGGKLYYVDNTFGGGFGVQVGPVHQEVLYKGKPLPFYNAMENGFVLAGKALTQPSPGIEREIRELVCEVFGLIIASDDIWE